MSTNPLNTSGSCTLDANGYGVVELGPAMRGTTWSLINAAVLTVEPTPPPATPKVPVCKIYLGSAASPGNFIDGTYSGNQDSTNSVAGYPIGAGEQIFAVWTGGDPGTIATLSITGTETTLY